jgi:molybdate transport system ATP-binding protein
MLLPDNSKKFQTPAPRPFITLDNICVRAGELDYFPGAWWRIHEREQWVILGPNGSGKSLLVGAIAGRARLTAGEVWYHFAADDPAEPYPMNGRVPEEEIAFVSLEDQRELASSAAAYYQARWNSLDAETSPTLRDYLRRETGRGPAAIRAEAARVGLAEKLGRRVAQLSNGELRRLLLLRALLRRPALLVLDDPFAGLDVAGRQSLAALIDSLMQGGQQTLLVVQREDEIPEGVTHALVVEEGRIVRQGPRREVLRRKAKAAPRHAARPQQGPAARRSDGPPVVELRKVNVRYGAVHVLRDLSWVVRQGEHWALLGPNGSGKSTLLGVIFGDNPQAYANDVSLFGHRRGSGESIWDIKRRIGWLAPELQWHYDGDTPAMDVVLSGFFDSIGWHGRVSARQRRSARAWLERLGLAGREGLPLAALSTGEQRVVLLARALVKEPELLLLDEPCQGLDAAHRALFTCALESALAERESTVIYVTHHEEELPASFQHRLRLDDGVAREG